MQDDSGAPYNYMVAAFDEQNRYELNFVKVGLGSRNAVVMIYGARIEGADYKAKAKQFLETDSIQIRMGLAHDQMPDPASMPRKEF